MYFAYRYNESEALRGCRGFRSIIFLHQPATHKELSPRYLLEWHIGSHPSHKALIRWRSHAWVDIECRIAWFSALDSHSKGEPLLDRAIYHLWLHAFGSEIRRDILHMLSLYLSSKFLGFHYNLDVPRGQPWRFPHPTNTCSTSGSILGQFSILFSLYLFCLSYSLKIFRSKF